MASADKSSGAMADVSVMTLNEVAEVPWLERHVQTQLAALCDVMAVAVMGTSGCSLHLSAEALSQKELSKNSCGYCPSLHGQSKYVLSAGYCA